MLHNCSPRTPSGTGNDGRQRANGKKLQRQIRGMDANLVAVLDLTVLGYGLPVVSDVQQRIEIGYAVKTTAATDFKHDLTGP